LKQSSLDQLRELRQRRKDIAMERLAVCEGALQQARTRAKEATEALAQYKQYARQQETQGLQALLGQSLDHVEMNLFQDGLMILEQRLLDFRANEHEARVNREAAQAELAEATSVFLAHHKRLEKLEYALKQVDKRFHNQKTALEESIVEETSIRHNSSSLGKGFQF
jgi:soluble cytochrome b562